MESNSNSCFPGTINWCSPDFWSINRMYNATTSSFEQCDYFINHEIRISSSNNQYTTVNILRFVRIRKRIIRIHIFIGIPIRIISYILRIPRRSIRIPKGFFPWQIFHVNRTNSSSWVRHVTEASSWFSGLATWALQSAWPKVKAREPKAALTV